MLLFLNKNLFFLSLSMNKKVSIKKLIKSNAKNGIKVLMVFFLLLNSLQYLTFAALTETTPVGPYTKNNTPSYSFKSDLESGAITYV